MNRVHRVAEWLIYRASWLLCMLACLFYVRLRTSGAGRVPARGGLLILSNHQSFLDPVVIGLTSPRKARFAARTSLFRFKPLGFYLASLGGIRLNRDGVATSGIKESLKILSADDALVYFPEGTRTPDGRMIPFRKGVGLVLRRSTAAVVFCGIAGPYDLWPRKRKFPGPGDVWVHYRLWRPPKNWKSLDEDALTSLLEGEVRRTFEEAQRRLAAFARRRPATRA